MEIFPLTKPSETRLAVVQRSNLPPVSYGEEYFFSLKLLLASGLRDFK